MSSFIYDYFAIYIVFLRLISVHLLSLCGDRGHWIFLLLSFMGTLLSIFLKVMYLLN